MKVYQAVFLRFSAIAVCMYTDFNKFTLQSSSSVNKSWQFFGYNCYVSLLFCLILIFLVPYENFPEISYCFSNLKRAYFITTATYPSSHYSSDLQIFLSLGQNYKMFLFGLSSTNTLALTKISSSFENVTTCKFS